ncbi:TRAP transporter small permease subunit [Halomonas binhaiensis]|uniref:TRAP transporter small permease protein n=1 Tax=Halomonas binhaiensis TaxID=2562282 RepID=A0A5C1NHR4_9GAMM|nr:TRAP transporter small permease [Halomonas binhaiensis]QEM82824.1 TRAP transporter small permease [Halomonas binhaiensis]
MASQNPFSPVQRLARGAAIAAGYAVLGLSLLITFEVVARKIFSFSLQGADEIGGYVLAVGVSFSFAYALLQRAHTRVDVVLTRLPAWLQGPLNALAMVLLAVFSLFMLWRAIATLQETLEFGSLASTPLQTPLWIPQGLWVFGLGVFAALATLLAARAVLLLGRIARLNAEFGPRSAQDELDDAQQDYVHHDSGTVAPRSQQT